MAEARDVLTIILGALGGFILALIFLWPKPTRELQSIHEDDTEYSGTVTNLTGTQVVKVLKTITFTAKNWRQVFAQVVSESLKTSLTGGTSLKARFDACLYTVKKEVGDDPTTNAKMGDAHTQTPGTYDTYEDMYSNTPWGYPNIDTPTAPFERTLYYQVLLSAVGVGGASGTVYIKNTRAHVRTYPAS